MSQLKAVIDTNVIFTGLLSKKGVSYKLLQSIPDEKFKIVLSVPLLLEYESVLYKNREKLNLSKSDIDDFLDYICLISEHTMIYFLWRPVLKDPYDDHILELAVSASAKYIITFNINDFKESKKFGIHAITPDIFLAKIRG